MDKIMNNPMRTCKRHVLQPLRITVRTMSVSLPALSVSFVPAGFGVLTGLDPELLISKLRKDKVCYEY